MLACLLAVGISLTKYQTVRTQKAGDEFLVDRGTTDLKTAGTGADTITVDDTKTRQTIMGFGSALTESSAYNWQLLSAADRADVIEAVYGKTGLDYQVGRCHIGSADFSLSEYGYINTNDVTLGSWSFEREMQYVGPFIKAAYAKNPKLQLFGSPWSPPAQWKDNKRLTGGGHLLNQYAQIYAEYMTKYLTSYLEEGIPFFAVSVQNEPAASQSWESCGWSGADEGNFAVDHLRPALDAAGLKDTKIIVWDHNRDLTRERAQGSYGVRGALDVVWGFGEHWYGGAHWDQLDWFHDTYPTQHLCTTELCIGDNVGDPTSAGSSWNDCRDYASEYINDLLHWNEFICEWNIILDQNAGPYHNRNGGVKAPINVNSDRKTWSKGWIYSGIGHFSKFIKAGAKMITISGVPGNVEACAAKNADGSIAVVILNRGGARSIDVKIGNQIAAADITENSLTTLLITE